MTPMTLIAEGPQPGRPSLLKATVQVTNGPRGVIVHEDTSGVLIQTTDKRSVAVLYPFNYKLLEDPPRGE